MNKLQEIQQDDNLSPYEKFEKAVKGILKVDKKDLDAKISAKKAVKDETKKAKKD